jgi:hypothetical protein
VANTARTVVASILVAAFLAQAAAGEDQKTPAGKLLGGKKADRIMFLGNSITLHGPSRAVDWSGNWGMAASGTDKDYVHILTDLIAKRTGKRPEILVTNIADFERNSDTYDIAAKLKDPMAFKPDIVVVAIGENVPPLNSEVLKTKFKDRFLKLLTTIQSDGHPAIVVRNCFWTEPVRNELMRQSCAAVGGVFVDLSGLDKDESNYARSERKYTHSGVAAHPGDKGMKAIADALFRAMQ